MYKKPVISGTKVTIVDVAKAAEVSTATVSRVINQDIRVRTATRKHVLEAMQTIGYKPLRTSRINSQKRTGLLGCILADRLESILHFWFYTLLDKVAGMA